jgi:hypothetical protein
VGYKLTEDRPTGCGISKKFGGIAGVSAIAYASCTAERVQEFLIGAEGRQIGKHSSIHCRTKRCIDGNMGSGWRQAVISD